MNLLEKIKQAKKLQHKAKMLEHSSKLHNLVEVFKKHKSQIDELIIRETIESELSDKYMLCYIHTDSLWKITADKIVLDNIRCEALNRVFAKDKIHFTSNGASNYITVSKHKWWRFFK